VGLWLSEIAVKHFSDFWMERGASLDLLSFVEIRPEVTENRIIEIIYFVSSSMSQSLGVLQSR